jgi:N-acetylglucosaminyl-diphospho-decaprenol L-rhamnosyltransferase
MTEPVAPVVRVVVVTWYPGPVLSTFLDSLTEATSVPFTVVLSDNGSTDGSVEEAARRPQVHVLRNPGNVGYGRAANAGAAVEPPAAHEEWVLVVNPDVTFDAGAIDDLLAAGARYPSGGAFGPAISTPDGVLYPSARALPALGRGVGHALCGWWWPGNPWTRAYRNEHGPPVEAAVGWLSGACLLLRRAAFDSVGGFDPGYFMYFEDLDLGHRLGDAGWASVYVPSAAVVHTGGHATQRSAKVRKAMLRAHHDSAWRYLSRRYAGLRWAPVRAVLGAGLWARYLLGLLVPRIGAGARPARAVGRLGEPGAAR